MSAEQEAKYARLKAKADNLLKEGDEMMKTKPAEGRRILRECLRYRKLAAAIKAKT